MNRRGEPRVARVLDRLGRAPSGNGRALVETIVSTDPERALRSYRRWRAESTWDQIGTAEFRLLPSVASRLAADGVRDDFTDRLRGIRRRTTFRNHMLARLAMEATDVLAANGIPTLWIKGLPLVLAYYDDIGARGMHDADLVVPESCAERALAALDQFATLRPTYGFLRSTSLRLHHGVNLETDEGLGLDLHWHVLQQGCYPGADAPFWEDTVQTTWQGNPVTTIRPEAAFFVACVHGTLAAEGPLLRWIPDATMILRRADPFDWRHVLELAHRLHLRLVLEAALSVLTDMGAAVPGEVTAALAEGDVDTVELRYLESLDIRHRSVIAPVRRYWYDFWMRHGRGRGIGLALPLFVPYLSDRIGTTPRRLPWFVLRRIVVGHHSPPSVHDETAAER